MPRTHMALVVVDMQNAYFEGEPLRSQKQQLTRACNELVAAARNAAVPVINVRTQHVRDRSTWTRNMLEDDKGFVFRGDDDSHSVAGLLSDEATEVVKTRDSAFFGTDLYDRLATLGLDTLMLCGVSTHTCIAATAADAYAHNLDVCFAVEAIASHRPELHESALQVLSAEYRFAQLSNAEAVALLKG